jgi:hypothetical protein
LIVNAPNRLAGRPIALDRVYPAGLAPSNSSAGGHHGTTMINHEAVIVPITGKPPGTSTPVGMAP